MEAMDFIKMDLVKIGSIKTKTKEMIEEIISEGIMIQDGRV